MSNQDIVRDSVSWFGKLRWSEEHFWHCYAVADAKPGSITGKVVDRTIRLLLLVTENIGGDWDERHRWAGRVLEFAAKMRADDHRRQALIEAANESKEWSQNERMANGGVCVACGAENCTISHKCDPAKIRTRDAVLATEREKRAEARTLAERLKEGFQMMHGVS